MTDIKQLAALTSLNSMMDKGYMDICCVDSVGKLLGINPKISDSYNTLHALHCVHYAKMPQELRDAIPALVQECLGVAPTFKFIELAQPKNSTTAHEVKPEKVFRLPFFKESK